MVKKYFKAILIVVLIMLSAFTLTGCGKNNSDNKNGDDKEVYERPLRNYMEGLKNKNLEQLLQAYPEFMHMNDIITSDDLESAYNQYEAMYGPNIRIDYNLKDAISVEDQDKENLVSELKELYPEAGDINIETAYIIAVELTITGDGIQGENSEENVDDSEKTATDEEDFYVYKYNGNWYMY